MRRSKSFLFGLLCVAVSVSADDNQTKLLETLVTYQADMIAEVEKDHGVNSNALIPLLQQLAKTQQLLRQHDIAVSNLTRALYIQRSHIGIYDVGHVPILTAMLHSHAAREQWDMVDNVYHHIEFIYSRNYEKGDPRWLPLYSQLYEWNMEAQYLNTGQQAEVHEDAADEIRYLTRKIEEAETNAEDEVLRE